MCQNEHDWFSQLTYRLKLSGRQIPLLIIILSLFGAPAVQSQNLQCIFSGTVTVDSLTPPSDTVVDLLRIDSSYIRTAYYQQGTYGVSALESDGLVDGDTLLFRVNVPNQPSFIARTFGDEPTFQGGFPPVLKTVHLFKNRAPLPFSLIAPSDSIEVDSVVNFRWRSALDPDGDSLVYTVNVLKDGLPFLIRQGISDTTVSIPVDSLILNTWFQWSVTAFDGYDATASLDTLSFILIACTAGFLGDINGDGLVNSTDALIALSFDAGLALPQPFLDRINLGFGDVNSDGLTNSTDALLIVSYDGGIPVPFPIGDPVCLPNSSARNIKGTSSMVPALRKDESITASALLPAGQIAPGATIKIPVVVDMTKTSEILGSYTATLEWNSDVLEFIDYRGGATTGFSNPVVNDNGVEEGKLTFAHAYAYGADGEVNILNVRMKVTEGARSNNSESVAMSLSFSAMAAAKTFTNLLPLVTHGIVRDLAVEKPTLTYGLSNYPNPFNPSTDIRYSLAEPGHVEIVIYNVLGQKMKTLVDGRKEAGNYVVRWHGMNDNGQSLPSGMYFVRMKTQSFSADRKLLFVK